MCMCMCVYHSLFLFLLGRVNGFVMLQVASSEQAKADLSLCFFAFDPPHCLAKGVTWAVTLFPMLHSTPHRHLKDHRVTQTAIHTTQRCAFVSADIHMWRNARRHTDMGYVLVVCADISVASTHRYMHIQTGHGTKLEGMLKVDSKISD